MTFTRALKALRVGLITAAILLIPLVAMQFTNEVAWTLADFVVAGSLLMVVGSLYEYFAARMKSRRQRQMLAVVLLAILLLIWVQLAAGI